MKKKSKEKPTFISLFCGAGGSSLGYTWAGFNELLAIDYEKHAVETFRLNFKSPVWLRDIKTVTSQEIMEFCKIKKGELTLLDASPPCQGFSTAGKRKIDDVRNTLFMEFVRLIDELEPKIFVMENVSGMIKGKMKGVFNEIIRTLNDLNRYNIKARLINAKYYDVPQSRQRLIIIGVRNDLQKEPVFSEKCKIITVKEAFQDLKINKNGLELTKLYSYYWRGAKQGDRVGKIGSARKLKLNDCANTMVKSEGNGGLYHPTECRKLHEIELKRISSFPDNYIFKLNRKKMQEKLGNSVPPKFMFHIAKTLKEKILDS